MRLAARMLIRPDLCTVGGIAHGGAIMSFADTLGAAAAFINLPADAKGTTTIESKTNFIAGRRPATILIGRTTLVHRGRRTQIWQTHVVTEEAEAHRACCADADEPLSGPIRAHKSK